MAASVLSLSLCVVARARARARSYWITHPSSSSSSSPPRAELEHAVTEASSTCFLEIDTLPSHARHAHHRRPRQPSESRSSPVGDPSCSSSSSLSRSLLLSSTSSSSLPVRPSFDRVRRLQRGFRCRVMSFRTVNKNLPLPLPSPPLSRVVCYFFRSFPSLYFSPSPRTTRPLFHQFHSSRENVYILKNVCVFSFLFFFSFRLRPPFFPRAKAGGEEDFTGGREDRIDR